MRLKSSQVIFSRPDSNSSTRIARLVISLSSMPKENAHSVLVGFSLCVEIAVVFHGELLQFCKKQLVGFSTSGSCSVGKYSLQNVLDVVPSTNTFLQRYLS